MTPYTYVEVGIRGLGLGLAVYGVVRHAVKPLIRRSLRKMGPLEGHRLQRYKDKAWQSALALGVLGSLLPDVWPDNVSLAWQILLGLGAGVLSVGIHEAIQKALPDAVARLLTGPSLSQGRALSRETGTWDVVEDDEDRGA